MESFISLYSNVGINVNDYDNIVNRAKDYVNFETISNSNQYLIESVLFLIKFKNGVLLSDKYDLEEPVAKGEEGTSKSIETNAFPVNLHLHKTTIEENSDSLAYLL